VWEASEGLCRRQSSSLNSRVNVAKRLELGGPT
jgi:hypothetical protein